MTGWSPLEAELDEWQRAGRVASFWWRDDDAWTWNEPLQRLAELAERYRAPATVAAVPAWFGREVGAPLPQPHPWLTYVQHGWLHFNHCHESQKSSEFPDHRPMMYREMDLVHGWERLSGLVPGAQKVFVPPWNRMGPDMPAELRRLGYEGFSSFGARHVGEPVPGLVQLNTHADLVDWKRGKQFAGREKLVGMLAEHLNARREGRVDGDEATGILTHHLDHDSGCWEFLEELFQLTSEHPAVSWRSSKCLFQASPVDGAGKG